MRPELETYHLIETYLNGKLEGEALRSFEIKLQSDSEFAEEVSFQKLTNEVVIGSSFENLRTQMTSDIQKIDAANTTKKWSLYTVAAFVLITGSVGYFYTNTVKERLTNQPSPIQSDTSIQITEQATPLPVHKTETNSSTPTQKVNVEAPITTPIAVDKKDTTAIPVVVPSFNQHPIQDKPVMDNKTITPQTIKPTTVIDPCLDTHISADITSAASCTNERTGSIYISTANLRGGLSPYNLSLDQGSSTPIKASYNYLAAGTHRILITDKNGCTKKYEIEIAEKTCRKTSFIFAPEKGETWKISGRSNTDYSITILNIAGTQVYKSQILQGEFEWQGIGQQGEYLSTGLYIYVIEYTNGQKENGQVTIVR